VPADYFARLQAETPTRVWVNNPTIEEIDLALDHGAVGCTTNPAYGGNLLKRAPDEIRPIIAECVRSTDDDVRAAELVQQRLVARIAERFLPLHVASAGRLGFVSIQGAPEADTDAGHILHEAHEGREIGPNVAPKIPATEAGLLAFEALVEEGSPTIVTEVFSLAQFVETCERYLRVTQRTRTRPPFFMSPITGIFGDHLKAIALRDGLPADPADMELAGVVLSRACYGVAMERDYPVTLLCGGARIPIDLTGLVGGKLHATINWNTFAEVMDAPDAFSPGIDDPIDAASIARLEAMFPDFRRAMRPRGLRVEDFEAFAPVQHFRDAFIGGWTKVHQAVITERMGVPA
jgi:transaldolase